MKTDIKTIEINGVEYIAKDSIGTPATNDRKGGEVENLSTLGGCGNGMVLFHCLS